MANGSSLEATAKTTVSPKDGDTHRKTTWIPVGLAFPPDGVAVRIQFRLDDQIIDSLALVFRRDGHWYAENTKHLEHQLSDEINITHWAYDHG
jgi:hypothetical protein